MTDPDSWVICFGCLHEVSMHSTLDGCHARDNLGNRCACEQAP